MYTILFSSEGVSCSVKAEHYTEGVLLVKALARAGIFASMWQGTRLVRTQEAA